MSHTHQFGPGFWTDDLPGYGPTVDWQIQLHSRRVTFSARASLDDDPHSTEHLIDANRVSSPVDSPEALQESIGVKAGGHLRDTL